MAIIRAQRPCEIYAPHCKDPHPDHVATAEIVLEVLRECDMRMILYEYPVHLYRDLFLMALRPVRTVQDFFTLLKRSVLSGMYFLCHFRDKVDIRDVVDQKLLALHQHKSQMTQLVPHPGWWTMNEVWHGIFLKCFLRGHEVFRCRVFWGGTSTLSSEP